MLANEEGGLPWNPNLFHAAAAMPAWRLSDPNGEAMLQPRETAALLREHHLTALSLDQQAIVILTTLGWRTEDIAECLFKATRTIRANLERAQDLVCVPLGLARSRAATGGWVIAHLTCGHNCLTSGMDLAQTAVVSWQQRGGQ